MTRPRVVIVGAGFGGLSAARALARAPVDVTVVDRHNYHLFQPLLYQVATASLSPADIASPIRAILADQRDTRVILGKVTAVDTGRREVVTETDRIGYDFLVLATGSRHAYFGHDDWEDHAHGLKKIDDATFIRRKILLAFERAETEPDAERRRALLTFVVVGGGPTGVEMAGAIAELARKALAADFRVIDPRDARIVLLEAGERVLSTFDPSLSAAAEAALTRLGVEVRTRTAVTDCRPDAVLLANGELLPTRTIVWGAGVRASRAAVWLGAEADRVGRVIVEPDLTVPGRPEILVIGDTAHVPGQDGRPLPGVAPVAKQQGHHVGHVIEAALAGRPRPPFRYRDLGSMATIGRNSAVAEIGSWRLTGRLAWWIWGLAHVYFLIGFRNRLIVATSWAWTWITDQRNSRLITGDDPPVAPEPVTMAPSAEPPRRGDVPARMAG